MWVLSEMSMSAWPMSVWGTIIIAIVIAIAIGSAFIAGFFAGVTPDKGHDHYDHHAAPFPETGWDSRYTKEDLRRLRAQAEFRAVSLAGYPHGKTRPRCHACGGTLDIVA